MYIGNPPDFSSSTVMALLPSWSASFRPSQMS